MQFFLGIFIVIVMILAVMILRSFTTLVHELGHALPALLFTRERVSVYIGTYGDISKSYRMQLGRLEIFFRINMLDWKIGMCEHRGAIRLWQRLIVILGGPLASVLLSIPLFKAILDGGISQIWAGVLMVFILGAAIDFFVNIIPVSRSIGMHDGSISYNDGYQLYLLLQRMRRSQAYLELEEVLEEGQYEEVIKKGQQHLENGEMERGIYDLMITAYMKTKQYAAALETYVSLGGRFKLKDADDLLIGQIYARLNQYEKALKHFQRYRHKHFQEAGVLAEMGRAKVQLGRYEEAKKDLDIALMYDPKLSEAYISRALANFRLRDFGAAHADLAIGQQLTPDHPSLHFYYGLLYEEEGQDAKALEAYERAEQLGSDEHGLEFRIATLRNKVRR